MGARVERIAASGGVAHAGSSDERFRRRKVQPGRDATSHRRHVATLGEREKARASYQAAVVQFPSGDLAVRARRKIAQIDTHFR